MKPNGRWFVKAAERSGRHGVAHETGYASRSVIVALAWAWICNFLMGSTLSIVVTCFDLLRNCYEGIGEPNIF